jgi:hypothetical protein
MKRLIFTILAVCSLSQLRAQPASVDTVMGWRQSLVAGMTLTQVAFTDWTQGGENALAYAALVEGKTIDNEPRSIWTTSYRFAFGQTRLAEQGLRKSDDMIDLMTVYTYKLDLYVNPYASATLKTQFAKGFTYPVPDSSTQVSAFFDPAYLTQSAGFGYQPNKVFRTRFGAGMREVITDHFNRYADDPATKEIEKTKVDGGLESVTNIDYQLDDNLLVTSQLELFDPFKHMDQVVVRSITTVTGKINKYMTALFSVQLINERQNSPKTQVKENIALGLSYTLF